MEMGMGKKALRILYFTMPFTARQHCQLS